MKILATITFIVIFLIPTIIAIRMEYRFRKKFNEIKKLEKMRNILKNEDKK